MTLPFGEVHRARGANANAGDLLEVQVGLIHRVLDAARDALDDGFDAALGFGAQLGGADALRASALNTPARILVPPRSTPTMYSALLLVSAITVSYLPARMALIFLRNSWLMSSAERMPSTMVNP